MRQKKSVNNNLKGEMKVRRRRNQKIKVNITITSNSIAHRRPEALLSDLDKILEYIETKKVHPNTECTFDIEL